MIKNRFQFKKLLNEASIFLLAGLILVSRPAILGEHFGLALYFGLLIILICCFLSAPKFTKRQLVPLILTILIFAILAIHLIFIVSNKYVVFAVGIGAILPILSVLFINEKGKFFYYFDRLLIFSCFIFSLSGIISYLLISTGLNIEIMDVQTHQTNFIPGYASLYFPFSILGANSFVFGDLPLPRNFGFVKEPGIFQMYLFVAIALLNNLSTGKNYKFFIFVVLCLGLISTFSGAAIATLMAIAIIEMLRYVATLRIKKMMLLGLLLIPFISFFGVLIYEFIYIKFSTETGLSRFSTILDIFALNNTDLLFGLGFAQENKFSNINFLSSLASTGLIMWIAYLFLWIILLIQLRITLFYASLPIFMTLVFFQPIFFDPFVWFWLFRLIFEMNEKSNLANASGNTT